MVSSATTQSPTRKKTSKPRVSGTYTQAKQPHTLRIYESRRVNMLKVSWRSTDVVKWMNPNYLFSPDENFHAPSIRMTFPSASGVLVCLELLLICKSRVVKMVNIKPANNVGTLLVWPC